MVLSQGSTGCLTAIARAKGIDLADPEVWFGDKARIGRKNKLTRRWARLAKGSGRRSRVEWQSEGRRGTRPSAPQDQRTASTYIFGAVCPKEGKGAGLVLPGCNTKAMALHLAAISQKVAPCRTRQRLPYLARSDRRCIRPVRL